MCLGLLVDKALRAMVRCLTKYCNVVYCKYEYSKRHCGSDIAVIGDN